MIALTSLLQRGPDGRFVRDTLLLSAGMAVAQLAVLAAMPVWSRLYGPQDFARYGLFVAVAGIASIVLTLRYDTCIMVAKDDAQARALAQLCGWLALGLGALLVLKAWLLPQGLREHIGLAVLGGWLPIAVFAGMIAALVATAQYSVNRRQGFARMSLSRIALGVVAALAGTAFGLAGQADGLMLAHIVAVIAALGVLLAGSRTAPGSGSAWAGRAELRAAARAHLNAPRYLWPSALLDVFTQQLPLLLIAGWYTQELAGQFSLAWRVVAVPLFLLAGAAGSVFFQRMSALAQQPAEARRLLFDTWRLFALIGAAPALVLLLWGEPLFAWAFGPPWSAAGRIAAALVPMLWAMLVSSPTSTSLIVLGLQKWSLAFGLAMLVYRPLAFWIGVQQGSLETGLHAWVALEIAAIVVYNLLILRRLRS